MKELDPNSYARLFGSSPSPASSKAFTKCLAIFLSTVDARIQKLEAAIQSRNEDEITHLAHQLKGSFRTLGGNGLGDVMNEIEKNSSSGVLPSDIRERLGVFKEELSEFARTMAA